MSFTHNGVVSPGMGTDLADSPQPKANAGMAWHEVLTLSAMTFSAATMSWFLYERPILNLKAYFPYARQSRLAESASTADLPPENHEA